ncbi:hypothetical protein Tco_0217157 [Tanacetum coccineum]
MTNKIDTVLKAIIDQIAGTLPSDTIRPKYGAHPISSTRSYPTMDPQCSTHIHSSINTITIHPKQLEESQANEPDKSIERFLNDFVNQPNETNTNDLESDNESVDTPFVSSFPHSNNDSDDVEVLNELIEYENVGMLCQEKAINCFDGDDLAFQCMIAFRKFTTYFDPFLPMNIITQKAYNTIMVEGLESTRKNLVAIVRDVYVFVGSFTYITDFVVLNHSFSGGRHGGNTRDLGSFGEETDKTTDLHQHLSRISTQKLETASQITRDAVTTHLKTASQDL